MFPYFGRKARIANAYPAPEFDLIIEPFAGSMAWSLHHRPSLALGFEVDTRVVSLWERIMAATEPESPPILGSKTDDLLVKLCSYSEHSLTSGPMTVTSRMLRDWDSLWRRFLDQGVYAREHLQIVEGSYLDAPDVEATWFIDPPYQRANRRGYLHGASTFNFVGLAEWCRSRRGQVIVCEQEGADWLPFEPLTAVSSHRGAISTEVVWLQGGR